MEKIHPLEIPHMPPFCRTISFTLDGGNKWLTRNSAKHFNDKMKTQTSILQFLVRSNHCTATLHSSKTNENHSHFRNSYHDHSTSNFISEDECEDDGELSFMETLMENYISIATETTLPKIKQFILCTNMCENAFSVCISGGATGADNEWCKQALSHNHFVIQMGFSGHLDSIPAPSLSMKRVILTITELKQADEYLKAANCHLCRDSYDLDLLRRHYYQIKYCKSLYAVGCFDNETKLLQSSVRIDGGTAWACQMFALQCAKQIQTASNAAINMYFFDQNEKYPSWKQCYITMDSGHLIRCDWKSIVSAPLPSGTYAGLSSRKLNRNGKEAIHNLFSNSL